MCCNSSSIIPILHTLHFCRETAGRAGFFSTPTVYANASTGGSGWILSKPSAPTPPHPNTSHCFYKAGLWLCGGTSYTHKKKGTSYLGNSGRVCVMMKCFAHIFSSSSAFAGNTTCPTPILGNSLGGLKLFCGLNMAALGLHTQAADLFLHGFGLHWVEGEASIEKHATCT